jgi:hypothetical protein
MEEISSSGSGEGPGQGNRSAYSTSPFSPPAPPPRRLWRQRGCRVRVP